MILGIDEVGRGPWAGPLVVGAVVLGDSVNIEGLTDSKKLSPKKRAILAEQINNEAVAVGLGWVQADELDEIGLSAALRMATIRAVQEIKTPYHEIILDGTINFLKDTPKGPYVTTLAKADLLVPAVSAASIVAKVARDNFMTAQADIYSQYGFEKHMGYGTSLHKQALNIFGVTPLHRRSFSPIAAMLNENTKNNSSISLSNGANVAQKVTTTTSIGSEAEAMVVTHLKENLGHIIINQNWRTKYCEIDIISEYKNVRYFTEVKARSSIKQGGGIAAITSAKRKQMLFAAELYNKSHKYEGNSRLMAAEVYKGANIIDGSDEYEVAKLIEII